MKLLAVDWWYVQVFNLRWIMQVEKYTLTQDPDQIRRRTKLFFRKEAAAAEKTRSANFSGSSKANTTHFESV